MIAVALGALLIGAPEKSVAISFGRGFWSLINFTMQMAIIVIIGYVVASSPPVKRFIDWLASVPKTGRGAIVYVAFVSMLCSMLNWALSLIFAGLLVRSLARRIDLKMDYRAAGAAAYLGICSVWALGKCFCGLSLQGFLSDLYGHLLGDTGIFRTVRRREVDY